MSETGKAIRLGRILNPKTGRGAVVAFDHGLHLGPVPGVERPLEMLELLAANGMDAVLLSPGLAQRCREVLRGKGVPALILRIDSNNLWREPAQLGHHPEGVDFLIAQVEDAVRLGADAVLTYLFVGLEDRAAEAQQMAMNAAVARACERWGMVCAIEPMARGKRAAGQWYDAEHIRMHTRIAAEYGADLIKTDYSGDPASYRRVVETCPVPILVAGGPKTPTMADSLRMVEGLLEAGAAGIFFGRNIVQAPDPGRAMRAMANMIHQGWSAAEALRFLEG